MTDTTDTTTTVDRPTPDFVGPMPQLQPVVDDKPKPVAKAKKPASPVQWVTVFAPRGGPCKVNRTTSQQGALVTAAIAAGKQGADVDTLVDAARPYTNKVTGDYVAYALSYLVPSWVQNQNGFGVQIRSTDRKLNKQLQDMGSITVSRALKLARADGKVDTLRIRVTIPADQQDKYKKLVTVH